jgi:biopolymer transport protein ExbD
MFEKLTQRLLLLRPLKLVELLKLLDVRFVLLILFCQFALLATSQVPDSIQKTKSKRLSLSKYPRPEAPQKKNAYVVVTSDKKTTTSNDPWENTWTDYIEDQSRVIAGKLLAQDSSRRIYKVMIDFWVNEDGSLRDMKVTSNPHSQFVVQECTKMAVNAPKRRSANNPGKYVRMHLAQPVDIKVKGDQ